MPSPPRSWSLLLLLVFCGFGVAFASPSAPTAASEAEDTAIADSLAHMLQAARSVISDNQDLINDPAVGNKGLTGAVVLARSVAAYRAATGSDPLAGTSRESRLLRSQMDAIVEVVDANQSSLNVRGVGFKAFIPAVFARLVDEAFTRRAGGEASIKVTAPLDLVRNRKSRPDSFETSVIGRFLAPGWTRGASFEAMAQEDGRPVYRMLVPEYYTPSCLSCHGTPKGSLDITGYPREGADVGDLGGVISITLAH